MSHQQELYWKLDPSLVMDLEIACFADFLIEYILALLSLNLVYYWVWITQWKIKDIVQFVLNMYLYGACTLIFTKPHDDQI